MKSNRAAPPTAPVRVPPPSAGRRAPQPPPAPPGRGRPPPPRHRRSLAPVVLVAALVLCGAFLLIRAVTNPGAAPTGTPGATRPASSGTPAATANPTADPTWSATRPAADLPADATLVFAADGRPLLSFAEPSGAEAGQRAWYAYDAAAGLLRRVPLVWTTTPYAGRQVRIALFRENGRANALAYGEEGVPRLFAASDGSIYYTDVLDGVYRFDARTLLAPDPPGAAQPTMLTPVKTSDGYDRDALLAFERDDGWTLTWANRPRLDDALSYLVYTTDRRGFLANGDVHADLRQVRLAGGEDAVVAQEARTVGIVGDVLVYEKRDKRLYLRDMAGAGGPAGNAEVRWTGATDQYGLFGKWLVYTVADGTTKHYVRAVPDAAAGASPLRSISCAAAGRIANLYRVSPDGDTLGLVWLSDRTTVASARLATLSLASGTVKVYDLKAALSADGAVDSFDFEGWVSDTAVLVAAVRDGQAPRMRIVDLATRTPLAPTADLVVREEAS